MVSKCVACAKKFHYERRGSATRRLCDICRDNHERIRNLYTSRPERIAAADQKEDAESARRSTMGADLTDENGRPTSARALVLKWMKG